MSHLPSPPSSLSPPGLRMSRQHSSHPSCSEDESDPAARSALEIRREKNRIKQRNLRLRRANQMTKLEDTVKSMQTTERHLDAGIKALQVHEKSLLDWIRDLETALVSRGGRDQVDSIRRMWSTAPPAVQLPPRQRDSLATLASAAAYQPAAPQSRWEEDAPSHKRRRSEDDYTEAMQKRQHGARLPSPSRMRIDQLCLPLPRPSSHSPPAAIAPEWGWSPHDHTAPAAYHQYEGKSRLQSQQSFDGKPRVIAGPSPLDSRSTAPRRPLSANSDGTRSWDSPVHSYDVRL